MLHLLLLFAICCLFYLVVTEVLIDKCLTKFVWFVNFVWRTAILRSVKPSTHPQTLNTAVKLLSLSCLNIFQCFHSEIFANQFLT